MGETPERKRNDHELTVAALRMAIQARKPVPGIIHHSDRGVQYACQDYMKVLDEHKFRISMSAPGNPYDNAFAESFMKTLAASGYTLAPTTCRRRSSRLYCGTKAENRNSDGQVTLKLPD